jgi:hypothetical protein
MTVTITSGSGATAALNVAEGSTAVTTVAATQSALVYSITGGADAAKFSINSSTGALTFVPAPDYEIPTDFDANNTYIVEVTATDPGNSETDVQTITITIADVAEGGGGGGSGTTYYIATDGNDSNNGTSTSTPWRTLGKATSTLVAGDTVYIKAGNYGNQVISEGTSGTTGEPISFIGYTSIPGDNPAYETWNHTSSPNPALMPCIDFGSRVNTIRGLNLVGNFLHVSGITVSNFGYGLSITGTDCSFARIYTREHGNPSVSYSGYGIWIGAGADRCVGTIASVVNANAQNITVAANNCVLDQISSYCNNSASNGDPTSGPTDYYFVIFGSNNTITNTTLERVGNLAHNGHGIQCKASSSYSPTGNVIDGFVTTNIAGGSVGDRHLGASGNTYRNGIINGGNGIVTRDGGNNSTYEDIVINNTSRSIWFFDANEDSTNTTSVSSKDNLYQRITFNNVIYVIDFGTYVDVNATASGNTFDSFTVNSASYLYEVGHYASATNILQNSTLNNVTNKAIARSPRVVGDNQTEVSSVTLNNCGFTLP